MKIKMKPVSSIKTAAYNPKSRTEEKNLASLKKSIKENGLLLPIMVDASGNLIDGHRRLAVYKSLRKRDIPTIEVSSAIGKDKIFETVNSTQRKINNRDMIHIYINGGVVPQRAVLMIDKTKSIIGDVGLKKLASYNASYRIYDSALITSRYIKNNNIELKDIIMWLGEHNSAFKVRRAMEVKVSKDVIINAIKKNKPLSITYK